ncbi:hypothetical protein BJ138DRAFT_1009756 [Hygrophoropsis aurantiaca]|uniref:Uncharacterized protein n=1 Tax=Hygrophoropsis aurantiaca TaxID=72124 RepID=A0ACB8A9X4_9AGAM|nr:hypothetical protein BJ138DRAFT_1009756 [Hygrophoropsis aurantiaca]
MAAVGGRQGLSQLFSDDDEDEAWSVHKVMGADAAMSRTSSYSDVQEENGRVGVSTPTLPSSGHSRSPYLHPTHQATASTSTFNVTSRTPPDVAAVPASPIMAPSTPRPSASRKPSSLRPNADRPTRVSSDTASISATAPKRRAASPSAKDGRYPKGREQRIRVTPRLPHADDVELAPATNMYWSKAPVHGTLPMRSMRAHTVTLVDSTAWLFGGCDDKGCWKDVYCFDTETMQWSHPEMLGEIPPPCRAHTATLVDRKIVIFGGGQGPVYYDSTYILDTTTRRWIAPNFGERECPAPRRAHTSVLYQNKIWVFGGGNGLTALNDLWTLDVGVSIDRMRWEPIRTRGEPPAPRGYHTANLVGNVMIVIGGSDGRECFSDVWCLNLDTLIWTRINLQVSHRRLSHTSTQVGSYLFIVGGHDGSSYSSEILLYNLGTLSLQYEPRVIRGKPPSPRGYHVTVIADSRLFVFGGFNGHDVFDDVHILDLAGAAYLPQVMSFKVDV